MRMCIISFHRCNIVQNNADGNIPERSTEFSLLFEIRLLQDITSAEVPSGLYDCRFSYVRRVIPPSQYRKVRVSVV